jgi:hypothetical protein
MLLNRSLAGIPRYVLLLQDLFKHTPEGHPDYKDLKDVPLFVCL